jgi:hypothetical protein
MRRTLVLSVAAALMATIILVVTGVVLSSVYRKSVERGFDARLSAYVQMFVRNLVSADHRLEVLPQSIGEPLFDLPLSGWYWRITALDQQHSGERTSLSLWGRVLPHVNSARAVIHASPDYGYVRGPENAHLRMIEHIVDFGEHDRYQVAVAGDASEIDDQTRSFHEVIAISFGFLATLLALIMFFLTSRMHVRLARSVPLGGT